MTNKKAIFIFGTRPETIKLAPLYHHFKKHSPQIETLVAVTGQHKEMLHQALNLFEISPDFDFSLMEPNQKLSSITSRMFECLTNLLEEQKPDIIITQGDTTTTFVASMAAFYEGIPVAHIEAGLRSFDNFSPFPEEVNRKIVSILSSFHFAPTEIAMNNLLSEGISKENILVSGNTVIDALKFVEQRLNDESMQKTYQDHFLKKYKINFKKNIKRVLLTGHRRESFGEGFRNICNAIERIARLNKDIEIIYPVHLNPNVQEPVFRILKDIENVILIEPQNYEPFIFLMINSHIILTDSGGVQEEAPTLGKPVLVMRENTERPEGIEAGTARLVGTSTEDVITSVQRLLDSNSEYLKMANAVNPYGDGNSSKYIHEFLIKRI